MGNFIGKIKQLSQLYKNYRYKKIIDTAIADMYSKNNTELPEPNNTMICPCIECKCNLEKSNLEKCNLVVCNCTCNLSEDLVKHILDAIKLRNDATDTSSFHIFNQKVSNLLNLYKNIYKSKENIIFNTTNYN
jgi:hypothetical protein